MANVKKTRIRIRGRWWKIIVARPPVREAIEGLCDYDQKTIHIKPGTELPATLFHEVLHATYPDLDEDAIQAGEEALMNALYKMQLLIP
jgi:hypothetical protein